MNFSAPQQRYEHCKDLLTTMDPHLLHRLGAWEIIVTILLGCGGKEADSNPATGRSGQGGTSISVSPGQSERGGSRTDNEIGAGGALSRGDGGSGHDSESGGSRDESANGGSGYTVSLASEGGYSYQVSLPSEGGNSSVSVGRRSGIGGTDSPVGGNSFQGLGGAQCYNSPGPCCRGEQGIKDIDACPSNATCYTASLVPASGDCCFGPKICMKYLGGAGGTSGRANTQGGATAQSSKNDGGTFALGMAGSGNMGGVDGLGGWTWGTITNRAEGGTCSEPTCALGYVALDQACNKFSAYPCYTSKSCGTTITCVAVSRSCDRSATEERTYIEADITICQNLELDCRRLPPWTFEDACGCGCSKSKQ